MKPTSLDQFYIVFGRFRPRCLSDQFVPKVQSNIAQFIHQTRPTTSEDNEEEEEEEED